MKYTGTPRDDILVLEAGRAEKNYWRDLWAYRELFAILAWRDLAVRYKQTVIGAAWALARPLLTMAIFTVMFGRLAKLPSDGTAPYSIMVFAGMLPWFMFSAILSDASKSLVASSTLISKVYFPRLLVPSATVGVALVDFGITFLLLCVMMAWYGVMPTWRIALLPAFTLLTMIASLGPALYLTALNVKYRDFSFVTPFILQFGLYVSPVGFSSSIVPAKWRLLYSLNPSVCVIDGFRWCLLGKRSSINLPSFSVSVSVVILCFVLGIWYFRKTEQTFADIL